MEFCHASSFIFFRCLDIMQFYSSLSPEDVFKVFKATLTTLCLILVCMHRYLMVNIWIPPTVQCIHSHCGHSGLSHSKLIKEHCLAVLAHSDLPHTHAFTHTHTCIHTRMRARTHTQTHTYTCKHTPHPLSLEQVPPPPALHWLHQRTGPVLQSTQDQNHIHSLNCHHYSHILGTGAYNHSLLLLLTVTWTSSSSFHSHWWVVS